MRVVSVLFGILTVIGAVLIGIRWLPVIWHDDPIAAMVMALGLFDLTLINIKTWIIGAFVNVE